MEKLLGLLFVVLGASVAFVAWSSLVRTRRFVAEASRASGEVIALRERGRGRRTTYAPVVRFAPPGGPPVEFTDETSSSPPGYRVGDRVNVLYRSGNPADARLASPMRLHGHAAIFAAGGSFFAAVGLALIYFSVFS